MIVDKKKWISDNGDGTYTNPILYTDYSDPDVCRVGDDYFMTASSFCNTPALPVLHSKDLVNWTVISYALENIPEKQYSEPLHGCGVWAPAIRYHGGEYIIFFPMPDEGIYVVKTKNPWGKWDEPTQLFAGKGWIDPCPFWDDDGKAYMVSGVAKSRIGYKSILNLCEITPDCLHIIGSEKHIFDGNVTNQETIEGPKLYKRNGYYYIFAPAGGVKQGWQTVLRSKDIRGPYEHRVVMLQKDTEINGPHQGAWVDTVTGEDWFVHFQDVYAAGRIIHLQPMRWVDDWPIIGEISDDELAAGEVAGKPVITHRKPDVGAGAGGIVTPDAEDDFSGSALGLQWQWNANHEEGWYRLENGRLVLNAVLRSAESISNQPNLLLQKWHLPEFCAQTKLCLSSLRRGDTAGLVSLGVSYGAVAVERAEDKLIVKAISGEQQFKNERASAVDKVEVLAELPLDTKEIYFSNKVSKVPSTQTNSDGPYTFPIPAEEIELGYGVDNKEFKTALKYPAKAGRWVGVKHGVFCFHEGEDEAGNAEFEYFKFV